VGSLAGRHARASIKEFPCDHPIAMARGSDNIVAFNTKRYSQTPLVIQGPGAGPDVTAMGGFSDILKLLHYLPHYQARKRLVTTTEIVGFSQISGSRRWGPSILRPTCHGRVHPPKV